MVTRFGMSEILIDGSSESLLGSDTTLLVSDETASKIDEEVLSIIKTCYQNAIDILEENKDKLHELAKYLLEQETISGEKFMKLLSSKDGNNQDGTNA